MKRQLFIVALVAYAVSACEQSHSSSKEDQQVRAALRQVKKVQSATKAGVSYADYSSRVVDAKVEVDSILSDVVSADLNGPEGHAKSIILDAMAAYLAARDLWGYCIQHGESQYGGLTVFPESDRGRYERYGVTFDRGAATPGDTAVIWNYASRQISEAENIQ